MNYKEALFFIGKCLTINHEAHNKKSVAVQLQTEKIDWDMVVQVSTAHYVFPALYLNLKKANFTEYLPEELVNYMDHITSLNRERNEAIINQVRDLQKLMVANGIEPIFLKGSGNLVSGLYDDIAERMVGDIDFLVSLEHYQTCIELLAEYGYIEVHDIKLKLVGFRHYPRLRHEDYIAAVEIHSELIIEDYVAEFNYDFLKPNFQSINSYQVLGIEDQLCLSVIAKQINDKGQHYKDIALRNTYDAFLLSKKCDTGKAISRFEDLKDPINSYLAICNETLNGIDTFRISKSKKTKKYLRDFYQFLNNEKLEKKHRYRTKKKLLWKTRIRVIKKAFLDKNHRKWLFNRIREKDWQEARMIEFGLKKPKPND